MRRTSWARAITGLAVAGLLASACGSSDRGEDAAADVARGGWRTAGGDRCGHEFGDLESPCGEGTQGRHRLGVTADSITIGYGDDAGYAAAPGLSHEITDAMEAIMDWCNDQGGINGRQIEGNYYDAKMTEVNTGARRTSAATPGSATKSPPAAPTPRAARLRSRAAGCATRRVGRAVPAVGGPEPVARRSAARAASDRAGLGGAARTGRR